MKMPCPHCWQTVQMIHDGSDDFHGDERTSPWVFATHMFNDRRGDGFLRTQCPTSGRNRYEAANSW